MGKLISELSDFSGGFEIKYRLICHKTPKSGNFYEILMSSKNEEWHESANLPYHVLLRFAEDAKNDNVISEPSKDKVDKLNIEERIKLIEERINLLSAYIPYLGYGKTYPFPNTPYPFYVGDTIPYPFYVGDTVVNKSLIETATEIEKRAVNQPDWKKGTLVFEPHLVRDSLPVMGEKKI